MAKLRATADNLICEKIEEKMTSGGIYLPDKMREQLTRLRVLVAGPGRRLYTNDGKPIFEEPEAREGAVVIVRGDPPAYDLENEGKRKLCIISQRDILTVCEE